jgi:hypothetical protein
VEVTTEVTGPAASVCAHQRAEDPILVVKVGALWRLSLPERRE